ncbi:MAG: hypothetical protein N2Z75_00290 [Meiothermus sp.]|jgi:hypothetical protein|nr:hypothetical protein [Meiothermus sp.]
MRAFVGASSNHRRVLQSSLAELEGLLLRLERALGEPPLRGYLYREENSLWNHPDSQQLHIEVTALRHEIWKLGTGLALGVTEGDQLSEFRSQMASAWVVLEELRPRRLAAYGPVSPALAEVLEGSLDRLQEGILRLEAWLVKVGEGDVSKDPGRI